MNSSVKALLLAAASTGLMSGTASAQTLTSPSQNGTLSMAKPGMMPMTFAQEKHACKGQNTCKGLGGCQTSDMGCKGKNSCKGKGGCKTDM